MAHAHHALEVLWCICRVAEIPPDSTGPSNGDTPTGARQTQRTTCRRNQETSGKNIIFNVGYTSII